MAAVRMPALGGHTFALDHQSIRSTAGTAGPRFLDRRTLHAAVGTEYATMAGLRLEQLAASRALVEIDARVGGHGFRADVAAVRARQVALQEDGSLGQFRAQGAWPLGANTITSMPAMASATPSTSQRVGLMPSTAHSQPRATAT